MTQPTQDEIYGKAIAAVRDLLQPTEDKVIDFVESTLADVLFQAEDLFESGSITAGIPRKTLAAGYVTLTAALVIVRDVLAEVFEQHAENCEKDHTLIDAGIIEGFELAIRGVASAGLAYADLGALLESDTVTGP